MNNIDSYNYHNNSSFSSEPEYDQLYSHLLSEDGTPLNREEILLHFAEDVIKSSSREDAAAKYTQIKSMRDFSKFQRDVALNAMLTSAGIDTIRHSQIYQESSEIYISLDGLMSDLENVLSSK